MTTETRIYILTLSALILAGCTTAAPVRPVTPVTNANLGESLSSEPSSAVQVGVVQRGEPLLASEYVPEPVVKPKPVVKPTVRVNVAPVKPTVTPVRPAAPAPIAQNSSGSPTVVPSRPVEVVEKLKPVVEATPPPPAVRDTLGDQKQQGDALASLLDKAADAVGSGNLDQAASALEQALRVEPNNASTWHDLGQVRMHQKQFGQAEAMAKKSINFAGSKSLKARNWRLIAVARRAQGNESGAKEADAKAAAFE